MIKRLAPLVALTVVAALGSVSPASAATVWNLDLHHAPTNTAPGEQVEYWIDVQNVGGTASAGTTTLEVSLPAGLTRFSVRKARNSDPVAWSCPGIEGDSTITCTTTDAIARHGLSGSLALIADVAPALPEGIDRFARAQVSGGGAAGPSPLVFEQTHIESTPAGFGILAETFLPEFTAADGVTPVRDAGSHPDLLTVPFDFATIDEPFDSNFLGKDAAEPIRDLVVDLPAGFVGNPTAVDECSAAALFIGDCPPSSQVGVVYVKTTTLEGTPGPELSFTNWVRPIYNISHPRGSVADLGFSVAGNPVHILAELDPARGYAIRTTVSNINETLPVFHQRATFWGVPADDSHDSQRCSKDLLATLDTSKECSSSLEPKPFLTAPARCEAEASFRLHEYDSWENRGDFGPDITHTLPEKFSECDRPRFEPSVSLRPTGTEAATPTGLDVSVHVPQNESPYALATPPIKSTTVTLPVGMAVNPAFSDGLQGCSESQIGLGNDNPVRCPDSSRIGELELSTPLLPGPVEGSLYLAEQDANPFGSLIAFYMAMHDTEERGVLIKVPAKVDLNPLTGQITTTFDDLPQLPFEDLTLSFRSGERAPLVNPPTCGAHRIEATMASYAQPDTDVSVANSYQLNEGPGGGGCVFDLGSRSFEPGLLAGTINPVAGAFSPMALRVSRSDADQELSTVKGTAPEGLLASLRGVERCSDAQIARAEGRSAPGQGAEEQNDPSCPAASQVGTVSTGAGAGPSPVYVEGKVYLAGPYKGAPLSGVAIVPAVAGPIDIGTVVVRAPARIDPVTAQLKLETDELPQVVNGVLVRVRDVRVRLDRPSFTINPTSCREKSLEGTLFSTEGKAKDLSNRFQVGDCGSLGFKPRLALRLLGGPRRGAHPAFRAVVRPRSGDANFSRAVVTLPNSAFLDQAHIRTICTRVQFAAGAGNGSNCPPGAVYGSARAWSPLVEGAFEGPVFLRSSNNKLPDMVVALKGPEALPIDFELSSRIDSVRGGIRSSFESIPDVPVSRFVLNMQGGDKGLIVNSRNLCVKPKRNRARANLRGQNSRLSRTKPRVVATKCVKRRKAKRARASHSRAR